MKVDIRRLVEYIPELFAPSIHDNQTFLAYLDADENSFTVQGDNLSTGGSGTSSASVERLEQSITTLQTTVDGIQSAMAEGAENPDASIVAVDDIVYGYYSTNGEIPTITPSNVIQLKGRPFLTDMIDYVDSFVLAVDNYLNSSQLNADVTLSSYPDNGNAYAAFRDRKIYTITNSRLSSVNLNNGDIIFNKADNALYVYDANNHKFIKASGKRHYVVDYLVDYIGQTLPNNLNSDEVVFFEINSSDFYYSTLHNHGKGTGLSSLNDSCCFANIQSTLNDDASIYALVGYQGIRVIHDLYDGDTVYNKADGCTYTFTFTVNNGVKSFVKTSPTTTDEGSGSSITVVDNIVYGAYYWSDTSTASIMPTNLKALRGRGFLDSWHGCISVDNFLDSQYLEGPTAYTKDYYNDGERYGVYAGFRDGKIHTYDYRDDTLLSSVPLNNGDFIFNKADNAMYVYDVDNHKFIKASGKRHYAVDMIIDYVGQSLPAVFNSEGVRFIELWKAYEEPIFNYMGFSGNNFTQIIQMELQGGFCFASIQSSLTDDAAIFEVIYDAEGVIVTHDLYDGDTIYNKADGCTYLFSDNGSSKSFSVISMKPIEPVLDIVPIGELPANPSAIGDKAIDFSVGDYNPTAYLNSSTDGESWDTYVTVENNACYASSSNHKIYRFDKDNGMQISDVPIGASFLNKADNFMYTFDGTQFVKTSSNPDKNPFVAPVLNVVQIGASKPNSASVAGEIFIEFDPVHSSYGTGYIYTADSNLDWEYIRDTASGERYASATEGVIYQFNGGDIQPTISDVPIGASFLNKANNSLYVFDGTQFIKITSS